ncbi:MAG: DNA topoisomerase IV subunit A [Clostridium sp.]|uniref:DNA topoisomerase IV subunit A n=1 Tax=Clostridium sp. TaxID=1506 RepID=UPI003053400E
MAKKKEPIPIDNNIIDVSIDEAMPDNYLPYAVEVSKDRALPDVRDGMKPVHRRILYGAYMLKAFPDKPYYKSARIVGDILGKYHPHGDSSVYDAMVILAQDFSTRKPLIDGHGNWGSIDGDNAAAMRYTEARLSKIAMEMLKDIDKGIVDMTDNYSDTEKEPTVLPARYPNLLVNGAFGIAVGLATNIPPHNLGEVIDGALAYADNEEITTRELMQHIKGPDLPTGGILMGIDSLVAAYETGEGKVVLRAKTHFETLESGRIALVITEFPYRKNKARLLQAISDLTGDKKHGKAVESIADIRDESDRNGIRAVVEFKKNTSDETAERVLKYLFKKTELQCNISFNMVALADGKPRTMGLKTIIKYYIGHQKDIVTRRTQRDLEIAEKRFHIVEGFIKAIGIMDEIIKTIRASKSKKDAGENLVNQFGFTSHQAEAILELMLYRLTGLEIKIFEKEHKELEARIKVLKKILGSEKELIKVIKKELLEVKEIHDDPRRTTILEDDSDAKIDLEELIVEEDVVVTMSNEGYIKRTLVKSFVRTSQNTEDIEYREGDLNRFFFECNTRDTLCIFTNLGNMYQCRVGNLIEFKWRDKGERIQKFIKGLNLDKEKIIGAYTVSDFSIPRDIMFITSKGLIKKTELSKFSTNYSKLQGIKLRKEEELTRVEMVTKDREEAFILINTAKGLSFTVEEPKLELVDRGILGKSLVTITEGDYITTCEYVNEFNYREFYVTLSKKGLLRVSNRRSGEDIITTASSNSELLFFTENGDLFKIPSVMIQNIDKKGIDIRKLFSNYNEEDPIVAVVATSNSEPSDKEKIYFFTEKGVVKKTLVREFIGDYSYNSGYKFKTDGDKLTKVQIENQEGEGVILTRKGMCIKFSLDSISTMGKNATGVMGITLKDDDRVVFARTKGQIQPGNNKELCVGLSEENLKITTVKGEEKFVDIGTVPLQNRAGRGKNLIVFMDDAIETVEVVK